ncbi:MAG TPA: YciI family protein [Spirochaetia bacterium]
MRFMVMVHATKETEAGVLPSTELFEAMGKFNEQLVDAGIMVDGGGLQPSAKGARVRFSAGGKSSVVDGPFPETKELIAGWWVWNVKSREEAVAWLKRAPFGDGDVVEIRQVFEEEDFGESFTPELREKERRLSEKIARRK